MPTKKTPKDWIQKIVADRAEELGLNALEISRRTKGEVSDDQVRHYLNGTKSMSTFKLQHLLNVLRLQIIPTERLSVRKESDGVGQGR
jgi:hypothetical protein